MSRAVSIRCRRPSCLGMRALWMLLLPAIGCSSISAAGGWAHHDRIVRSGLSQGPTGGGLAAEVGGARTTRRGEVGVFATYDRVDHDYDQDVWVGASVRYRRNLGSGRTAAYVALGGGTGVSTRMLRVEAHAELGARMWLGAKTALTLSLRERPAISATAFDASLFNVSNKLELALGLELAIDRGTEPEPTAPRRAIRRRAGRPSPCSGLSWYLEPSLWFGAGSASAPEGTEYEVAVRNAAGVILSPCREVTFRIGLSLSRYWGAGNLREDPTFETSSIGYWGFGPEVEADLVKIGGLRFGLGLGFEIGDRSSNPRPGEQHPVILRWSARARWRGASLGFNLLHSSGTNEPGTTAMFGVGFSGKPPWIAIITELIIYIAWSSQIHHN